MNWESLGFELLKTGIFAAAGLLIFAAAFYLICKVSPFSIRKELEEDQNTALGIVIGSFIIGIAIIIGACVFGYVPSH